VPDRAENHIAAQALMAMRLRRQFEKGEITHQEYLDRLEGQDVSSAPPAPEPPAVVEAAGETRLGQSQQTATEPRLKLAGALEVLHLRGDLEKGKPAPPPDRPQFDSATAGKNEPVPAWLARLSQIAEPEPVPVRKEWAQVDSRPAFAPAREEESEPPLTVATTAADPMPAARATVAAQAAPEQTFAQNWRDAASNFVSGWKRRPRNRRLGWVLAGVGGTFVLAAALQPMAVRGLAGLSRKSPAAQQTAIPALEVLPADLTVAEAGFTGPAQQRRIAGVLKNGSNKTYTGIEVTFSLVGADGDTLGVATAMVDRIGGHETARFEANNVKQAAELVFQRIETHSSLVGTP
jgi:hypothetical protein